MIAGVDEAGRGPVIGPLVIALVAISDETKLDNISLKDSKQCSPSRREKLKLEITKVAEQTKVVTIPAADIDAMRKTMTLNNLEVYGFSKLISEIKPDICYVDSADVNAERFGSDILKNLDYSPKIISQHKADIKYPIVSAASIIAKTTRDRLVSKIENELSQSLDLPLGSGYPADPITIKFLHTWFGKYGSFPPYIRLSWKTTQNIISKFKNKSLDEF